MIFLDFETRSRCDLKARGAARYAADATTEILCLCWAVDGGAVNTWIPPDDADLFTRPAMPAQLRQGLQMGAIVAWNHFFDHQIAEHICVERWGWSSWFVDTDRWWDAMAMATARGLPANMGKCATYLRLAQQKSDAGARVMRQLSTPDKKSGKYSWTAQGVKTLAEYCAQDVEVLRDIVKTLGGWSRREAEIQRIDLDINRRGIEVDVSAVSAAAVRVDDLRAGADADMSIATGGVVRTVGQVAALKKWCASRGVHLDGCGADELADVLTRADLPDDVRAALEARDTGAGAALKKYEAILGRVSPDSRLRGEFVFNGAITGRWSSRGVQLQNMPSRGLALSGDDQIYDALDRLKNREDHIAPGIPNGKALKALVRSMFTASSGGVLLVADYSQIEARLVMWLAGETDMCEVFDTGGDPYKEAAAHIFGVRVEDVTKEQRSVGKSSILGCGYGMGAAKFAAQYNVSPQLASAAVNGYRERFPGVTRLWRDAERDFCDVMAHGGTDPDVPWTYRRAQVGKVPAVVCDLPCGRDLTYLRPEIGLDERITIECMSSGGAPYRAGIWGGDLVQNVVSALAASVLRDALRRLDAAGFAVVATVHDEIIIDIPAYGADAKLKQMIELMTERAPWLAGAPIGADGWIGTRYRK
jgi:DNA polymerase